MNVQKSTMGELKRDRPIAFNRMMVTLLLIFWVTTGCALIKLKQEVNEVLASTVIVGRISTDFPGKGPIVVAAYTKHQGKRQVAHYTIMHDFGEYELMVAKGNY